MEMASTFAISFLADLVAGVVTRLVAKIGQKASAGNDFDDTLQEVTQKLNELNALLIDADKKSRAQDSQSMMLWIRNFQAAALDTEDLLELHAAGSVSSHFRSLKNVFASNHSGLEIKNLNAKIDSLKAEAEKLGLYRMLRENPMACGPSETSSLKKSEIIFEISTPVDMDYKLAEILSLMQQHRVVAVVGMGGIGKTRLLQHVHRLIKDSESNHQTLIWLSVSQTYSIKELQLEVLRNLGIQKQGESESLHSLQRLIYDRMKDKDCLVVLDDVWNLPDTQQYQASNIASQLRSVGFPSQDGCRFLISTRDYKVAQHFGSHAYSMPLLSSEKSYELFMKHLLPHSKIADMVLSQDQDQLIKKKLLKKCGGLPLAIIALAETMKQQLPEEWPSTFHNMETWLSSSATLDAPPQGSVINMLKPSFNALEFRAKTCFAFLGVFDQGEEIFSEKLIGMWVAEGLVESEDEGLSMLKHLRNKCLLLRMEHPPKCSSTSTITSFGYMNDELKWVTGREYIITVHELGHDLAVMLWKESGGIHQGSTSDQESTRKVLQRQGKIIRRLRTNISDSQSFKTFTCPPSVRQMSFSRSQEPSGPAAEKGKLKIGGHTLENAQALRILDIGNSWVTSVPSCMAQLQLLRFLDISRTSIRKLPRFMKDLKHLKYLYVVIWKVPSWIGELQSLTHFCHFHTDHHPWRKVNKIMPSLKVVRNIPIEIASGFGLTSWTWDALAQHTQLKQVDLRIESFKSGVFPSKMLERLYVGLKNGACVPEVTMPEEWGHHLEKLEFLELQRGVGFPRRVLCFQRLTTLTLHQESENYPGDICKLPQLRHLQLEGNSKCEELPQEFGKAGAFPQLHTLQLWRLNQLKTLPPIEYGAMPYLTELEIVDCHNLLKAGSGWENKMGSLQKLKVDGIDSALAARFRQALGSANR